MSTAFFILTSTPSRSTLKFADELADILPNVYIISDQESDLKPNLARIVYISDDESRSHGYFGSSPFIPKTPISWDKALYYFSLSEYEHAWFCEDDVLFESSASADRFVKSYKDNTSDLLCKSFFDRKVWPEWPHWGHSEGRFSDDESRGAFLPLCRLSRRLAASVDYHVKEHRSLALIEVMIPSLVNINKLHYHIISEINYKRFRHFPSFNYEELWNKYSLGEVNIFHPVKSDEIRLQFDGSKYSFLSVVFLKLYCTLIFFYMSLTHVTRRIFSKILYYGIQFRGK